MKKKLLIVESPAKIKTISKFLGSDFIILSTMGHIKDLPSKKLGVTINTKEHGEITLDYVVLEKKIRLSLISAKQQSRRQIFTLLRPGS